MHLLKRNAPACAMNHDAVTTEKMGNVLVIGNSGLALLIKVTGFIRIYCSCCIVILDVLSYDYS